MSHQNSNGKIITLKEVKDFLAKHHLLLLEISKEKIEELYHLIDDHGYLYISDPEQPWLVCADDEDAHRMACIEITGILELDSSIVHEYFTIVGATIDNVCKQFDRLQKKDKIAFYITVLNKFL